MKGPVTVEMSSLTLVAVRRRIERANPIGPPAMAPMFLLLPVSIDESLPYLAVRWLDKDGNEMR